MDTLAFVAAHEAFERQVLAADNCECDGWSARLVAAHVIGTDRLFTETAARILFGTKLMYGKPAIDDAEFLGSDAYLRAIVDSVGDRGGLLAELARSWVALVAIVSQLSPSDAATAVPARIVDGARVLVVGPVPFAGLLQTHARVHIPAHAVEVLEKTLTRTD
jgi:hypothetical protein